MKIQVYEITPIAKPRMTRQDKWKTRKCVAQYRAYKDEVRNSGLTLPEGGYHVIFILPIPKSYSRKKRWGLIGKPHRIKPDKDNLEKGLLDALFTSDAHIWDGRVSKIWGEKGKIIVKSGSRKAG